MATSRVVPLLPNNGIAAEAPLTASLGGGLVTIGIEADAAAKAAFDQDASYPPGSIGDSLQQVIPGSALELRSDLSSTSGPEKGADLVGFLQASTAAIGRSLLSKTQEIVSAYDFGAIGDGAVHYIAEWIGAGKRYATLGALQVDYPFAENGDTIDYVALQAQADYIGTKGGGIMAVIAGTYLTNKTIYVDSNTYAMGGGRVWINPTPTGFVGKAMFRNRNWSATALTDKNIRFDGLSNDYGDVTVSGGGAHMISMQWVDGVTVYDCESRNGENVTAFLHCRNTVTDSCRGFENSNCPFDHWNGTGTAKVINCYSLNITTECSQGIQFSGNLDDTSTPTTTWDCVAAFNTIDGIRRANRYATAITFNGLDDDSRVYSGRSICNYVRNADIGLMYDGFGGRHVSLHDTFDGCGDTRCVIMFLYASGRAVSDCDVISPTFINCGHRSAEAGIIVMNGVNNRIKSPRVVDTGAPGWTSLVNITANAINCRYEYDGSLVSGTMINNSTSSLLIDTNRNGMLVGTWSPILRFGGDNIGMTFSVQAGEYRRIGKMVHCQGRVQLSAKGTSVGAATISLPFVPAPATESVALSIGYAGFMAGVSGGITGAAGGGNIRADLRTWGATGVVSLTDANFANNSILDFACSFAIP